MQTKMTPQGFALALRQMARTGTVPTPLPREASQAVGFAMLADLRQRFQTSTAPDGTKWRPLKRPRVQGGNNPLLNTGQLRNSFFVQPRPDGAAVVSLHPAAGIHHTGGTIRPKRAKHLAIPLTREAQRAGSPRKFRKPLRFVGRGKNCGVLVEELRGGRTVAHFALVKKVVIPARPYLGLSAAGRANVAAVVAELAVRNWLQPLTNPGGSAALARPR